LRANGNETYLRASKSMFKPSRAFLAPALRAAAFEHLLGIISQQPHCLGVDKTVKKVVV